MINCALVVESKFSSRKALIRDLEESKVAEKIIEARSVDDGYLQLENSDIDACLLGPALTPDVAERFVREGRGVLKNPSCAFIAVLEPGANVLPALRQAGVDGTITTPYQKRTFTDVCQAAVDVAKRRAGRRFANMEKVNVNRSSGLSPRVAKARELSESISHLAEGLREVANKIARGDLRIQPNGKPSLATQDAIRLALENEFPGGSQAAQFGTYDHYFISRVVEWFVLRINQPHEQAVDELRSALSAFPHHLPH